MLRLGLAIVAAGALLWLGTTLLSPHPTSSYELGEELAAAGSIDASRVRLSAYRGSVHSYDAANDTTFLYVSVCSHQLCGPLVPVKGDLRRDGLPGPLLLTPVEGTLALAPVPTPREENASRHAFLGPRSEGPAFSSAFEASSPFPPFLGRLAAVALVAGGAGIALRGRWWAALPALGVLAALLVARSTPWVILVQIVGIPGFLIALLTALSQWAIQRRGWVAAGLALGFAVAVGTSFLALAYFPGDGGD